MWRIIVSCSQASEVTLVWQCLAALMAQVRRGKALLARAQSALLAGLFTRTSRDLNTRPIRRVKR
jgi:hypothetical protein